MSNIKSVRTVGKFQTYDLEVNHPDHQYYLSNGVLTSNSHAVGYSILGFQTAYLKAHYPLEFLVANLMIESESNSPQAKDNIAKLKEEIRSFNINIIPPDINTSEKTYKIINDNTLMTGFDSLTDMGKNAIPEIIKHRPFNNFEQFLSSIDSQKLNVSTVKALVGSGALDSFGLSRKLMYLYASDIKKKLQVWIKKPVEKRGEFKYPYPDNLGEWTIPEKFAMEMHYIGEGISGNTFEVYNNFFNRNAPSFKKLHTIFPPPSDDMSEQDRKKYTKHLTNIQAVIKSFFEFRVRKEDSKLLGQVMSKLTLQDPFGNQINMTCFPDKWLHFQNRISELLPKHKLEPGIGLFINGDLNWYDGNITIIFGDISRATPKPQMPEDLEAKKVRMPRTKASKEEKEEDREGMLEEVEDQLIESGNSDLDDEDPIDGFI